MRVQEFLMRATEQLNRERIESSRLDAELLVSGALGWSRQDLYFKSDLEIEDFQLAKCRGWLERRAAGEPVAYILGLKGFYKHEFLVSPQVLIPRPETELLVGLAFKWLVAQRELTSPRIIDLGSGSGCIGLSLLSEIKSAALLSVDNSSSALEVLRENSKRLGVEDRTFALHHDAGSLSPADVFGLLGAKADVLVANPPYIAPLDPKVEENVKAFEPANALFSGEDGLEAIRSWSKVAPQLVRPGGLILFEIGSDQGAAVQDIFRSHSFLTDVTVHQDLAGLDRVVQARRRLD